MKQRKDNCKLKILEQYKMAEEELEDEVTRGPEQIRKSKIRPEITDTR